MYFIVCLLIVCILRAPRQIGAIPVGLPSLNKVFTYLLVYDGIYAFIIKFIAIHLHVVRPIFTCTV